MLLFIFLCPFSGAEASVEAETADQSCALSYVKTYLERDGAPEKMIY